MGDYEIDEDAVPAWMKRTSATRHVAGTTSILECNGCGHEWRNRVDQPTKCPDCGAKLIWEESADEQEDEPDEIESLFGE